MAALRGVTQPAGTGVGSFMGFPVCYEERADRMEVSFDFDPVARQLVQLLVHMEFLFHGSQEITALFAVREPPRGP